MSSCNAERGDRRGRGTRLGRPVCVWSFAVMLAASAGGTGARAAGTIRGTVVCRGVGDCGGAVVYVDRIPGKAFPSGPEVVVDQRLLTFAPHVLTVVTGTPVVFLNSDDVWHNVFSVSEPKRFNLGTTARGTRRRIVFDKPGVVEILCNVHLEMSAFIVVTDTPYVAMVDSSGTYTLEQIPAGTYTVVAWREELELDRREVTVVDQATVSLDFELRR